MFKKILIFGTVLYSLAAGIDGIPAKAQEPDSVIAIHDDRVESLVQRVEKKRLQNHVARLDGTYSVQVEDRQQTIHSRNVYHPDMELVLAYLSDWIERELLSVGMSVKYDRFTFTPPRAPNRPVTATNIVITKTGTLEPDKWIMISAHYDSIASYQEGGYDPVTDMAPGANDDASGTAAVLEIARLLRNETFERSLRFVLYSGEEYGLYGSRFDARKLAEEGLDIAGVVNIDMIGPERVFEAKNIVGMYGEGDDTDPPEIATLLYQASVGNGVSAPIRLVWAPEAIFSDHFPFWYHGYPAVFLGHGTATLGYHTFNDRAGYIDFDYLMQNAKAALATVAIAAGIQGGDTREILLPVEEELAVARGCGLGVESAFPLLLFWLGMLLLRRRSRQGKALFLLYLLAGSSCAYEVRDLQGMLQQYLVRGNEALAEHDTLKAKEYFALAQAEIPGDPRPAFGMALADTLDILDLINFGLNRFSLDDASDFERNNTLVPLVALPTEGELMGQWIVRQAASLAASAERNLGRLQQAEDRIDFAYPVSDLNVRLGYRSGRISFTGELRDADVQFLISAWSLVGVLAHSIQAYDLNWDWTTFESDMYADGPQSMLSHLIALLDDKTHPDVLSVISPASIQRAGQLAALTVTSFRSAITSLVQDARSRSVDPADLSQPDRLFVADCDDQSCTVTLGKVALQEEGVLQDIALELTPEFSQALVAIDDNLSSQGPPVELVTHLFTIIQPLASFGSSLMTGNDAFVKVLFAAIPNVVAFDFGAFFRNHAGVRNWMPTYTVDVSSVSSFDFEWECTSDHVTSELLCDSKGMRSDSEHFMTGSPASQNGIALIAADGRRSRLPYVPFRDPSFDKLLYIDTHFSLDEETPPDFQLSDNYLINALMSNWLSGLVGGL